MTVRDLPILFSGAMVRALLAGTKTQTRRDASKAITYTDGKPVHIHGGGGGCYCAPNDEAIREYGPYYMRYAVGDRLYVREHWYTWGIFDDLAPSKLTGNEGVSYIADTHDRPLPGRFRQGMHMPRWASRITLTVTDVRVERLQDISRDDAMAEGIVQTWGDFMGDAPEWAIASINRHGDASGSHIYDNRTSRENYRELWNHINGPDAWAANPWVAAYTFTVERGNIDQLARAV